MVYIAFLILILLATAGVWTYLWRRRTQTRTKKNYERALKLVPLLIHLPPVSEDIEANGRDVRDIVDENISKAQIVYNIIGSTLQKGFKSRLYGQRHFAFEIVGSQGLVYFYAMVPIVLVDVIKQAIISAYPSAQVEEVAEHNIFNPVGKMTGVAGGEFELKKEFAYPIATYQEIKRDTMQAILNALSTLEKEDGACIQILMRPADPSWQSKATTLSSNLRKGKKKMSVLQQAGHWGRQLLVAFTKPPETGESKKEGKELSSLEQSVLDSIDEKTRHQGYETMVRVVVSSNISRRAQAILANVVASFSLFDAQGRNGFKYSAAQAPEALVRDYIMRSFPQQNNKMILNSVELATLFHFPDQRSIPTSQLRRQESKQVDAPRNMPTEGLLLGYNLFRSVKKPIRLGIQDRQRHMYVVGQTGTGKSTFLENLALQDMLSGNGFAFVDPHGDTAERLLSMVPKERTEDIIYFSPADMTHPMGLNLFEFSSHDQKDFIIQEVLNMLYKLYDPQHQGIMGPRYEDMFRNAALAVMADPNGGTFIEIPQLFRDPQFLKKKLQHVTDQTVLDFWQKQFPAQQRSNEAGDLIAWFVSKFGAFLSNEMMRNMIGQTKSAFDLREIMDNKKILLVNLSKGRTGDLNSKLLGMIFVMKFQAAAMSRANIPEDERQDFALYVDEFQNFSTDSFATIMSEARKYHLNLIVANQYTTQLTNEIRDAVFGNIGTIVGFRVGQNDVDTLAKYFQPAFSSDDLLRVPNYNTVTRTLVGGVPTQPFSMATLPPLGSPNPKLADALKQLSAAKYGRPKVEVEKEIFARMKTLEPPHPSFGAGLSSRPAWPSAPSTQPYSSFSSSPYAPSSSSFASAPPAPAQAAAPKPGSSFLDEWLAKRQPVKPTAASEPFTPPAFKTDASAFDRQPTTPANEPFVVPQQVPGATSLQSSANEAAEASPNDVTLRLQGKPNVEAGSVIAPNHSAVSSTPSAMPTSGDASDTIFIDQEGVMHPKQD